MTDEETALLRRKWKYQNKWRTFGNVLGKMEGFETMDFSKEGLIILYNGKHEFSYTISDKTIEISFPAAPDTTLRLRISELTSDKLVVAVSGKGKDKDLSRELVELYYAPMADKETLDIQKT